MNAPGKLRKGIDALMYPGRLAYQFSDLTTTQSQQ